MVPRFVLPARYSVACLISVEGGFNPGKAAYQTPLAALAFSTVQIQVYWRDLQGRVVFCRNTGSWGGATVIEPIGPGYRFAVLQWDSGKYIRLYIQHFNGSLGEYCSDDGGSIWFPGEFHLQ